MLLGAKDPCVCRNFAAGAGADPEIVPKKPVIEIMEGAIFRGLCKGGNFVGLKAGLFKIAEPRCFYLTCNRLMYWFWRFFIKDGIGLNSELIPGEVFWLIGK